MCTLVLNMKYVRSTDDATMRCDSRQEKSRNMHKNDYNEETHEKRRKRVKLEKISTYLL